MTPEELNSRLQDLSERLFAASLQLAELSLHLTRSDDRRAARSTITDLHWATENCTAIGLHQIGEAFEDPMGFGGSDA